ncbi:GTPase [uncultured Azohydromonas sp.]|jgi:Predicted GTPase|uniref:GTPase n=1 Tax=uncultured Azohydromonas sp. TaxID=487342 RepID=UPI0026392DFD|nr:GTPase [uncultured Azohydromonas sp.]
MSIDHHADQIRRRLEEEKARTVSVALFGQPGAGKSSLINKMVGRKVAEVGVETDKTVELARYEVNGLQFVDLPGYGTQRFPKQGYAERFGIRQMDLFLCVTSGKLHQADTELFRELDAMGKVCLYVVNRHDELWEDGVEVAELERRKREDISRHVGRCVPVLFTSCRTGTGLDALQQLIAENLEGAKRERWLRNAKAYSGAFLDAKRAACEKYVTTAALACAANGLNPIPGADVAVDLSILLKLFAEIRECYGLDDRRLDLLARSGIPLVAQLANNVVKYAAREGAVLLLKRYVGRQTAKSLLRYVPGFGQAVAAGLGYAITSNAGTAFLDDCHALAGQALQHHLGV